MRGLKWYRIKQFYSKQSSIQQFKGWTIMCDEINSSCPPVTPPWEPPQVIPAQMRRVNNLIFRKINQFHRENEVEDVTPMHEWILSYLFWHRDEPIYQRDIEREFSITRSTVTNILQLMERKGYIERQSVPQDARLKRLVLTEKGACIREKTMQALHQTDEFVESLLTPEENAELLRLLNKLRKGLQ
ncbi:MAG: winged helix-turn-helix transcriptional regulator [Faecalibacterium prausnitzii]|nr:winged helix-turn-helix transcriptional regulator [Faecalibacterium prausnitzii]